MGVNGDDGIPLLGNGLCRHQCPLWVQLNDGALDGKVACGFYIHAGTRFNRQILACLDL